MRQGWEIKKLGDIGTFQRGGGFLKSDFVEDGYPCVHYGQIHTKFGVKTYNHLTCISEELALSKSKIANSGDIIIAITSEDVEGSCKCTAWLGDYDVAVGGHAAIFKHGLNPAFVAYYFRGPYFNTAKKVYAHGSKVVEIRPADIATINISYPSLSEQEKIVAELDCLSGIIEKKKQQLKELDNLAQSIFYEMFGDPIENDKGWKTSPIKDVAPQQVYKGNVPCVNGKYWLLNLDVVVSNTGEVLQKCYFELSEIGNSTITFSPENVLYSKLRPYLNKVVLPNDIGYATSELIPLCPNKDFLDRVFLAHLLRSSQFVTYISNKVAGAKMPRVSMGEFRTFPVMLPPLALQQDFASKIESIEKQKELIANSIKETETLFNSRMDYYFN